MAFKWSEEETIKLLVLYRQYECLKYPFDETFDKKMCRYQAYKHIVDVMNIPCLTIYDCITRIENLKQQYCCELSKIATTISHGKYYEPKTKYFQIMHEIYFSSVNSNKITKNMAKDACIEVDLIEKEKDDEFDIFSKNIAYQLRNSSLETAIELEKQIQDLVTKERLNNIKWSFSSDNVICCCSCSNCEEIRKKEKAKLSITKYSEQATSEPCHCNSCCK